MQSTLNISICKINYFILQSRCVCSLLYLLINILKFCIVFLQSIKTQKCPQVLYLTAGVIIIPRRIYYFSGRACKGKSKKIEIVSQCRKRVSDPTHYSYTMSESFGWSPKPKKYRQPIRIEHEKPSNFVSQSESGMENPLNFVSQSEPSITSPESSVNQNRVLRHPRALG